MNTLETQVNQILNDLIELSHLNPESWALRAECDKLQQYAVDLRDKARIITNTDSSYWTNTII